MRKLAACLVVLVAFAVLPVAPAGAHATLLAPCPAPGDVIPDLQEIELVFRSELIDDGIGDIQLTAVDGEVPIDLGPTVFSEDLLTMSADVLVDELAPGRYLVFYAVTSADGDLNEFGFEFTIDPDAEIDSGTCEFDNGGAAGWILLGSGVVAVGALVFFLRPRKSRESVGS